MGKIAFVFSGQGDQKVGMCKDLFESYPTFKATLEHLEKVHHGLIASIYDSTDDELMKTINTQPALYAIESAISAILAEMGIRADVAAGFSLGEIAALSYAGSFSMESGMNIVSKRAEFMQEDAEKYDAIMTAVIRLSEDQVSQIAEKYDYVFPVNFNCPGQIVCSGLESEIKSFEEDVKENGGRCIRLSVKGAFHSPFMNDASEKFASFLDSRVVSLPTIPTYSNYLGMPYQTNVKDILALQIKSPVLWQKSVMDMLKNGVDTFIEIGPGTTLSSIIRKIKKDVRIYSTGSVDELEKLRNACEARNQGSPSDSDSTSAAASYTGSVQDQDTNHKEIAADGVLRSDISE